MRIDEVGAKLMRSFGLFAVTFASVCLLMAPQVFAQDSGDEDEDEGSVDEITVTGSRLKRTTYTSISPLQIITSEVSREVGLIDPADILSDSTATAGQTFDLTLSTNYVNSVNGPGATTVNLRALGEARTLVLVNGRRIAPAGVEGAPAAPDLGLIPQSLVQQYEILLDGASSVYGSDAVAGVTNVIMRKDFEGLDIEVFSSTPDQSGGMSNTISAAWGKNMDRGFIGIGIEYEDNEEVTLSQREWTGPCSTDYEIDTNGQIRTQNQFYNNVYGMRDDGCYTDDLNGRVSVPFSGSIYYTPGSTNGGWPGFSESSMFGAIGVDGDGDGVTDVSWRDYDTNGLQQQFAYLFPEFERTSFMAYGEYTFAGDMNLTPFFEAQYSKREVFSNGGAPSIFPAVPANNPFNICNPNGIRGVDCGDAYDALLTNPNFEQQMIGVFGLTPTQFRDFGIVDLFAGPIGPASVTPLVSVRGDRNLNDVEVDQTRIVGGLRGDLPFVNWGSVEDWSFEAAVIHTESTGTSSFPGIRGDRLDLALGVYSTTNTPCENDVGATLASDAAPGCVPVDLFAPSLHETPVNADFATAAERDYLFGTRFFDTEYNQLLGSLYATGTLGSLPGGEVLAGFGFEYRDDEITSIPNETAAEGLLFGFFKDGGASGDKWTREFFGEIELPFVSGVKGAEELTLNLSGRYTKDEFYDGHWTYSTKLGYRPVESLLLRATAGTSFRAPNLRENFLIGQTGFSNVFDPCFIPEAAINDLTGGYDPTLDTRSQLVLDNCLANGADPTALNNNGVNTYSVEVSRGGGLGLTEETSDSISLGFAFDQPWWEDVDLTFGATYYKIEIDDTIISPGSQFIVNQCYNSTTGNSAFCDLIARDSDGFLDLLDAEFFNRDKATAEGIDINAVLSTTVTMFGRPVDWELDLALNHGLENSENFVNSDNEPDFQDYQGQWGIPDWQGNMGLRADVGDYRFTWNVRYIGDVAEDPLAEDEWTNIDFDSDSTCFGPDNSFGFPRDYNCRDASFADDYFLHSASLYYYGDVWTVGLGIRNMFNEEPPRVDPDENFETLNTLGNTPVGYGYDLNGRTYFLNVAASFTGLQ